MQLLQVNQVTNNKLQQRASACGCRWTYLTVTIFAFETVKVFIDCYLETVLNNYSNVLFRKGFYQRLFF